MNGLAEKLAALTPERRELLLDMMRAQGISEAELPIQPVQASSRLDAVFPLSFEQERLWIIEQLEPGNPAYHMFVTIRLEGDLRLDALEAALTCVIERYESLRTTFSVEQGIPRQRIGPPIPARINVTDLRSMPMVERLPKAMKIAEEELRKPFDLPAGPLYRCLLARMSEVDSVLALTVHHILTDNWSMGILIRELEELYTAHLEGRKPDLPALPIQYADFAAWQKRVLTGRTLTNQLEYWRHHLAKAPPFLPLATDFKRPLLQTFVGARQPFALDQAGSLALGACARRNGATVFMAVLAAHPLVLHRLSGADTVVIGIDVAGRNRPEVELLFGFFVNQLAIVVEVGGRTSYTDLLKHVRAACVAAYTNQDVPFQRVVEAVQERRDRSRSPIFQAKMVHLNFPLTRGLALPGVCSSVIPLEGVNRYELELVTWEESSTLTGLLEYNTDLYRPETARVIVESLLQTLRQAAVRPDAPLETIAATESAYDTSSKAVDDDFDF